MRTVTAMEPGRVYCLRLPALSTPAPARTKPAADLRALRRTDWWRRLPASAKAWIEALEERVTRLEERVAELKAVPLSDGERDFIAFLVKQAVHSWA